MSQPRQTATREEFLRDPKEAFERAEKFGKVEILNADGSVRAVLCGCAGDKAEAS